MSPKKCLISLNGESYRYRLNGKSRGCNESIEAQNTAIKSHLDFCSFLKNTFDLNVEIFLNIYTLTPELDELLYTQYLNHPDISHTHINIIPSGPIGENNLLKDTVDKISNIINDDYVFVFLIRIDYFFKKYLHTIFDLREKIRFGHLNEIGKHHNSYYIGVESNNQIGTVENDFIIRPKVNHGILYVPHKFFFLIYENNLYPEGPHDIYVHHSMYIPRNELDFFLYSSHSCDTSTTWNPLFEQVGRHQSKDWPCNYLIIRVPDLKVLYRNPFTYYDNLP
jgi:hypothetical protein